MFVNPEKIVSKYLMHGLGIKKTYRKRERERVAREREIDHVEMVKIENDNDY